MTQFPSSYDEYVMREADGFKVEMPYCFVQSSSGMKRVMPRFWKYVDGRRWVFKEELYVPLLPRIVLSPNCYDYF